jgi:hypothetical protein
MTTRLVSPTTRETDKMNMLKTLTFITAPTQINDPTVRRRGKLIERLEQQKALFSNPAHHITEQRWVKDENGTKQLMQKQKLVHQKLILKK